MAPSPPPSDASRILIRRASPDDAAPIAAIYNHAIAERIATFETEPRTEAAMRAWIGEHDKLHPILVAEIAGDGASPGGGSPVVAWASITSYRPRECYAGVGEFSIYVRQGYRGKAVGRQLLSSLIDAAGGLGYWKLVSRIFPQNVASRRLVARCGFREVGVYEKHGKLDGRWMDTIIVERLISENLR